MNRKTPPQLAPALVNALMTYVFACMLALLVISCSWPGAQNTQQSDARLQLFHVISARIIMLDTQAEVDGTLQNTSHTDLFHPPDHPSRQAQWSNDYAALVTLHCASPVAQTRHVAACRSGSGVSLDALPGSAIGRRASGSYRARALLASPPLLLADEPTGSLDFATGLHIMSLLDNLRRERGCTLVVVTHDTNMATLADRHLHMIDGCTADV